ncbi:MAG: hypothetical protein IPL53_17160 [Ignavibacteria bacterium]|nr:hypothetical protein [Ignavibacteria bacterium]
MKGSGFRRRILKSIFKPFVRMKNSKIKHTGGARDQTECCKEYNGCTQGKIQVESCQKEVLSVCISV